MGRHAIAAAVVVASCYQDVPGSAPLDAARDAATADAAVCFPNPLSSPQGWSLSDAADITIASGTLGLVTEPGMQGYQTSVTSHELAVSSLAVHVGQFPLDGASTLEVVLRGSGSDSVALVYSGGVVAEAAMGTIIELGGTPPYWGFQVSAGQVIPQVGSSADIAGSDKFTLGGKLEVELALVEGSAFEAVATFDQLVIDCTP